MERKMKTIDGNAAAALINSSLIAIDSGRDDNDEIRIPVNDLASQLGNVRTANIVALGAFVTQTQLVDMQTLLACVQSEFAKKAGMISLNMAALEECQKAVMATV